MSDHDRESAASSNEKPAPYEAPVVVELEANDGPAITAAGASQDV